MDIGIEFAGNNLVSWYRPTISQQEAEEILMYRSAGSFIVRRSNTTAGFGLAVKVDIHHVTPHETPVRHYLIEQNAKGVRLKGYPQEPVFPSLVALLHQHIITRIALPVTLTLDDDLDSIDGPPSVGSDDPDTVRCALAYLGVVDCEALAGEGAIEHALNKITDVSTKLRPALCDVKVDADGITCTDKSRRVFFRRHFPMDRILYCGEDPQRRLINLNAIVPEYKHKNCCVGVVVRKKKRPDQNECHVFAGLDLEEPNLLETVFRRLVV